MSQGGKQNLNESDQRPDIPDCDQEPRDLHASIWPLSPVCEAHRVRGFDLRKFLLRMLLSHVTLHRTATASHRTSPMPARTHASTAPAVARGDMLCHTYHRPTACRQAKVNPDSGE
jgi:hypothetical protein